MKKTLIFILTMVLFGLAVNSYATSPMPEELRPGPTAPVCVIHIVYMPDIEKGIPRENTSSTLVYEVSESKKDVFEKVTRYLSDKLNEGNISEFKVECKFPKQ